jgi:hypothetical protein
MELELGVLSVAKKLVQDLVHPWRPNFLQKISSFTGFPNSQHLFLVKGDLEVNS